MSAAAQDPGASADEESAILVDPLSTQLPDFVDWLPAGIKPLWETVATYPAIGGLVIAALFYIGAHIVRFVLSRSLSRLAVNTRTDLDNRVLDQLKRPIFNTIFLFGLTLAVNASQLPFGTQPLVHILLSLIVVSWMRATFSISTSILDSLAGVADRYEIVEARTIPLFDIATKLFIILLGSYCLLLIWGINPVGWLASAGIVGIAVGFAAKDTLANLFSGFFILVDSPYQIGDYVNLDSGERGRVSNIGMRSTRLMTRDDIEITVPNAVIANAKIINESGGPHQMIRVRVQVGVAYGSDVDLVCAVLQKVADDHPEVCNDPAARVRMRGFGASSLDFELLGWIDLPENRGRIRHELFMQIYKAFAAADIEIPYTKTDVYIKEIPQSRGAADM